MTVLEKLLFKNSQRIVGPYLSPMFFKFGYFGMDVWNSAVGDWGVNTSTIIIKRDDDGAEEEFLSIDDTLDAVGVREFLEWNLLDGGAYRDFLKYVPLGVDTDFNDVSDGWNYVSNSSTLIGEEKSVTELGQMFKFTNATVSNSAMNMRVTDNILMGALEEITLQFDYNIVEQTGVGALRVNLYYYDSGGSQIGSTDVNIISTTVEEAVAVLNKTTPALCVSMRITILVIGNVDSSITVYFKNAKLIKNDFIENIGLLTKDGGSGVAEGWIYEDSAFAGTIVKSVSISGQKMEITVGDPIIKEAYIYKSLDGLVDGDIITFSAECRVVGDVSCRLVTKENPSGTFVFGALFTNTEWETITQTITIGGGDTEVQLRLRLVPNQAGSTGYVEYRNATLKQTNNSADVVKVFDKSGNGNYAHQKDALKQPNLVKDGVFRRMINNQYAMWFDGVDDFMDVIDENGLNITVGNLSLMANFEPAASGYVFTRNTDNANNVQYGMYFNENGYTSFNLNGAERVNDGNNTPDQKIVIGTYDHISSRIYLDSVEKNDSTFTSDLLERYSLQIGCRGGVGTKEILLKGFIERVTVFDEALSQKEVTKVVEDETARLPEI